MRVGVDDVEGVAVVADVGLGGDVVVYVVLHGGARGAGAGVGGLAGGGRM